MAEIKRRSDAFGRVANPQRMMAMSASDTTRLADLRIAEVKPDPGNPRKEFAEADLAELAASLKRHGLLQPIVVRKVENDYIILAGERRWRAAQLAEFVSIKAVIHTESRTAANVLIAQIIENEQRAPLSTAELVSSIARLLADGMGVTEIAEQLSMNRPRVSKLKALTELPDELKPFLDTTGIDPLYEMLQQHKANPASVQAAIESGKAPTRAKIREAKRSPATEPAAPRSPIEPPADQQNKIAQNEREALAGERDAPPRAPIDPDKQDAFAGERKGASSTKQAAPLPSYRDQGSITVSHADHGQGRVVFGLETMADRLPILFAGSPDPIQIPLAELTIVDAG